jgi:hypothetical protein
MKSQPSPFEISTPCPKQWDQMSGDAKRRFCEHCQLHVHNVSTMAPHERRRLESEARGGRPLCIAYQPRSDGSARVLSFWQWVFSPLQHLGRTALAGLATVLPFLASSCEAKHDSKPLLGEMVCPKPSDPNVSDPDAKPLVGKLIPLDHSQQALNPPEAKPAK